MDRRLEASVCAGGQSDGVIMAMLMTAMKSVHTSRVLACTEVPEKIFMYHCVATSSCKSDGMHPAEHSTLTSHAPIFALFVSYSTVVNVRTFSVTYSSMSSTGPCTGPLI